jgi:ABC-type transport system involved in multi-copper enzyme maturation permease subunit
VSTGGVVASEWIKLRSLRSSWLTLAAAVIGMIGIGWLVSFETNSHWAHMQADERAGFDPVSRSLTGVYLAQLAIGVLGVLVITGEYATGMIRATLSAVPRRLPVLWAKLGVFCAITFVLMLVSAFAAFLVGQQLLGSHGTTLSAPHALRAVIGVALYLTVVAALAVGLGFMVRSTAGGIASLFGLLLVLPAIGHVLPTSWQQHILPYLPSNAGGALYSLKPDPGTLAPWTGFGVMCVWAAVAILGAMVVLRRRDA